MPSASGRLLPQVPPEQLVGRSAVGSSDGCKHSESDVHNSARSNSQDFSSFKQFCNRAFQKTIKQLNLEFEQATFVTADSMALGW